MYENNYYRSKYDKSVHDVGLENICIAYNERSTLAYIISRKGLENYLRLMNIFIDNPIDLFLFDKNKSTNQYAIKPESEQPFYSSFFENNGDPDYEHSIINKTQEIIFKI